MRLRWLPLACAALVVGSAPAAFAQKKKPKKGAAKDTKPSGRITTKVVDVAGGRAYVEPGQSAGLRTGDTVVFAGKSYTVIGVSPSHAVLELGKLPLKIGATGLATIDPDRAPEKIVPISKPAQLAAFRGIWPKAELPAASQHPKNIPLGPVVRTERSSVAFTLSGYGVVPTGDRGESFVHGELRGALHYEPIADMPLAFDVDLGVQSYLGGNFSARDGDSSRPLLRVRALQAAYGNEGAFLAALGRLRYASSTLGMLDGVRVGAPIVGGLSINTFGGFVPDPLSTNPATRASRFGGELVYEDDEAEWRPRAVIGGHASRFEGAMDERRLDFLFDLNPRFGRMGVFAEASLYDKNNPWGANTTELSAAGADASFRIGALELGGRASMQRPERSRYLASLLPAEWLCITNPTNVTPEPCLGNDATYWGSFEAGLNFPKVVATAGANASRTENTGAEQTGAYTNLRLLELVGRMRLDAGAMTSQGTLLNTVAFTLSPGLPFMDGAADVALRYRPAVIRYRASTEAFVEHSIGGALWVSPSRSVDVSLDADYVTGRDLDALIAQLAMVWRTGF
jgi:hypothetical protein